MERNCSCGGGRLEPIRFFFCCGGKQPCGPMLALVYMRRGKIEKVVYRGKNVNAGAN